MTESLVIKVQLMERDLSNIFEGRIPSFPVSHFGWTLRYEIQYFQEYLQAGKMISTLCMQCRKIQQQILRPQSQDYTAEIAIKYND
jgi:hypothetical protein